MILPGCFLVSARHQGLRWTMWGLQWTSHADLLYALAFLDALQVTVDIVNSCQTPVSGGRRRRRVRCGLQTGRGDDKRPSGSAPAAGEVLKEKQSEAVGTRAVVKADEKVVSQSSSEEAEDDRPGEHPSPLKDGSKSMITVLDGRRDDVSGKPGHGRRRRRGRRVGRRDPNGQAVEAQKAADGVGATEVVEIQEGNLVKAVFRDSPPGGEPQSQEQEPEKHAGKYPKDSFGRVEAETESEFGGDVALSEAGVTDAALAEVDGTVVAPVEACGTDAGLAGVGGTDVAPAEVGGIDIARYEVGCAVIAPAEVCGTDVAPAEVDSNDVAPGEVDSNDVAPAEVGGADVALAEADSNDAAPTEVGDTDVATAEVCDTDVAQAEVSGTDTAPDSNIALSDGCDN